MNVLKIAICLAICSVAGKSTFADILMPDGLVEGDQYRIAFITSGVLQAEAGSINFYDSFITAQALSGSETSKLGTATWKVIGSSADDNANSHTNTLPSQDGVPIFLVDGSSRIADDYSDLWNLSLDVPLNLDQNGNTLNGIVFTGTSGTGARRTNRYFGSGGLITTGDSSQSSNSWISGGESLASQSLHFYGISDVQTVTAVPEPGLGYAFIVIPLLLCRRNRSISQKN